MVRIVNDEKVKKHYCPNKNCKDYKKISVGNLIRKGFNAKGVQMLKCKTCGMCFAETSNTVFHNQHLTEDEIILVYKLLVEKNNIRAIERITEHHRDTISSLVDNLAKHARAVTAFLIKDVGLTKIQVDEMWSFVKKNKRKLNEEMKEEISMAIAGYT